jgi:hypothetical protein
VATVVLATVAQTGLADAIVGGNPTSGEQYPYYVRLTLFGHLKCGGSVIADEWVLTAAHCVDEVKAEPYLITAHISDRPRLDSVLAVVLHPLWNGHPDDGHDLALLRLPREAITGSTGTNAPAGFAGDQSLGSLGVDPVQVGSPFDRSVYAAGTEVFVVGRGLTAPSTSSPELRDLHTVLRSDGDMDDVYNRVLGFDHWHETLMIGAGFTDHTICHGDSGGPLTVNRNGRIIQVGVAGMIETWPHHCAEPGAFMELDGPQLAWVASVVPSIMAGWGPCTTSTGAPGDPYAVYGNYSGVNRDGPYGWVLGCQGSTPPPPLDEPDGPIDSVCMRKPWLCPDN